MTSFLKGEALPLRESRRALYQGTTLLALKNTQKTLGFRVCVRTRNAGISAEKFAQIAADAKANCPVSRLLRADISLNAKLEPGESH